MNRVDELRQELRKHVDPVKADFLPRFFKTYEGGYAESDTFIGVTVPRQRFVAKQFKDLSMGEIKTLLYSPFHEERLVALFILVHQFQKGDGTIKKGIYNFYLSHMKQVNNWDLVDSSADKIVGGFLVNKADRSILEQLARSTNLWEKRIAIIATFQFIKEQKEYKDTFRIAQILAHDQHDLVHKAVGWMLREVGGRISVEIEEEFLKKHYKTMPRTMLRYAIEKFPEEKRKKYLLGTI